MAAHGWPEGQVSLAYTVTVVCSTMAPLFFGGLIRRISTRMCIALGAVLFGGGLFLTGAMTQLWQLFLFYGILSGLGCGFIYGPHGGERGRALRHHPPGDGGTGGGEPSPCSGRPGCRKV
ncbi:MAG: hypothetical protein SO079_01090 [Intestinimonas butyriciproducens]|nr:hypothetical protein [Intestinimonas butyriciproducens]MDY3615039.1 hypothetical protein [Intestinimonas butyriciproducens]